MQSIRIAVLVAILLVRATGAGFSRNQRNAPPPANMTMIQGISRMQNEMAAAMTGDSDQDFVDGTGRIAVWSPPRDACARNPDHLGAESRNRPDACLAGETSDRAAESAHAWLPDGVVVDLASRPYVNVMEQTLLYRDVEYVIGPEQDGHRLWTIRIEGAPESGIAGGSGVRGSFKTAVMAAREAIDARLDSRTTLSAAAS